MRMGRRKEGGLIWYCTCKDWGGLRRRMRKTEEEDFEED